MALTLTTVTVTGSYIAPDGTPMSGSVTFELTHPIQDPDGNVIVSRRPVVASLSNGSFSVPLVATDDPDGEPDGVTYTVTEDFSGIKRTYNVVIPYDAGETVDLADLAPSTTQASYTYALQSALAALSRRLSLQVVVMTGELETGDNVLPPGAEIPWNTTLVTVKARVGTAPVGDDIEVRVNVTHDLATNEVASVTIPAGETTGETADLSIDLIPGDTVTWDIVSVGSGTAGADLRVDLVGE